MLVLRGPLTQLVMAARMAGFNPAMEAAIQPLHTTSPHNNCMACDWMAGSSPAMTNYIDALSPPGEVKEARRPMMYSENRPWGSFHVLDEGKGFKVKRIVVTPGG